MSTVAKSVKVAFGDDIRRFSFEDFSFGRLQEMIRSTYGIQAPFIVQYLDDENDRITIASNKELELAFQLSANGNLKIFVHLIGEQPKEIAAPMKDTSTAPPMETTPVGNMTPPMEFMTPPPYPLYPTVPVSQVAQPSIPYFNEWKDKKDRKIHKKVERKIEHLEKKMDHLQQKALKFGVARLVEHTTCPDGTVILPGHEFVKTWKIRNESTAVWTTDFLFLFKKGDQLSQLECVKIPHAVSPGEELSISVPMKAPSTIGVYYSVWKLAAPNGKPFGQQFHVKIAVCSKLGVVIGEADLESRMAELSSMGFNDRELNERLFRKCKGDMDKMVWKLLKKQQKMQFKQQKVLYKMEKVKRKAELKAEMTAF